MITTLVYFAVGAVIGVGLIAFIGAILKLIWGTIEAIFTD